MSLKVDYQARLDKLRQAANGKTVVLVPGWNMVYFTGLEFHLSERPVLALLSPDGHLSFIIPNLEIPKLNARPDLEGRAFGWSDTDGYSGAFEQAVKELGLKGSTLAVDGLTMRVTEWLEFNRIDSSMKVNAIERDIIGIMAQKMPDEVEFMRRACQISEAALDKLLAWVQPGMTERQIATRLSEEMGALGSEGAAFEPLVQTGPNSALPHGMLTDRVLGKDEFLLIDYGGRYAGYPADITRTFCLGTPTAEMVKIYDTVKAANEAALKVGGPGVAMGDVDKAARDVINAAGYGQYFIHRTGHGLGLAGHEIIPQIAEGVTDLLEPGMAFTIEPGIYVPGLGGVRIEDNVVVTDSGLDVLTSFRKSLQTR
ncbi:MAG: aminopeptidase P family protein [Anaerolineae bacterium]